MSDTLFTTHIWNKKFNEDSRKKYTDFIQPDTLIDFRRLGAILYFEHQSFFHSLANCQQVSTHLIVLSLKSLPKPTQIREKERERALA